MFPETPILWNEARPSTGPHSTLPLRNAQGCSLSAARIFTCSETQRPGMTSHYAARIGGPAGTDLADCRQGVDRGRQRLDLAPAMVRHHEAVNAERKRGRGIVRMEDALEHQRPF